jgi:phosphoglycerate dehydrogenase-like enzyme
LIKKGAVLINTSRGDVINENELIRNLKSGKISFAGLDVYSERLMKNSSMKKMKNIILTPHIGAQTIEAKERIGKAIIEKVKNFQKEFEEKAT